jgi:hypothetical protein
MDETEIGAIVSESVARMMGYRAVNPMYRVMAECFDSYHAGGGAFVHEIESFNPQGERIAFRFSCPGNMDLVFMEGPERLGHSNKPTWIGNFPTYSPYTEYQSLLEHGFTEWRVCDSWK